MHGERKYKALKGTLTIGLTGEQTVSLQNLNLHTAIQAIRRKSDNIYDSNVNRNRDPNIRVSEFSTTVRSAALLLWSILIQCSLTGLDIQLHKLLKTGGGRGKARGGAVGWGTALQVGRSRV
jgi:hypothetical protein